MSHKLTTLALLPGLSISGTAQAGNTLAFCESPNETRLSNQSLITRLCFAVICAIVFLVPNMVNATTIGFDGLSGNENGSSFSTYTESGFTVQPVSGDWLVKTDYGYPPPFIYFTSPQVEPLTAGIRVTNGGSAFQFSSVDLYSSMTRIPYTFSGFLNSAPVFTATGEQFNTFGDFATVLNQSSAIIIDALEITLVNPAGGCPTCINPMGLDTVVLLEATVPEPTIFSLLFVGLVSLVLQKRRNKKIADTVYGWHRK